MRYLQISDLSNEKFELEHLKDISYYNDNCYRIITPTNYMATLSFINCNIVEEKFDEEFDEYTYTFGMLDGSGNFNECFLINTNEELIKEG